MALQQINWLQIDTANVPSGSSIDLGNPTGSLHAVYADNLYLSGQTIGDVIAGAGTSELNLYTASLNAAIQLTGSNLTVKGNLLVKGNTTIVQSTVVTVNDNVIELNGSEASSGGLLVKDVTNPNRISGSLLWNSTTDQWVAGPLGSEQKIVLINEFNSATSSLSSSINTLSSSLSSSITSLSQSIDNRILNLSSSLSSSIDTLSGSINNRINNVSSSLGEISSSINTNITNISSSFSSSISILSGSLSSSISQLSSSLSSSITILSQSIDGRIDNVSSSLGEISSSIDTNITNLSSSFSSSISAISGSLSERIDSLNQFSSSISGAIEVTGSNVTIKGDLFVKGTTTSINSTTVTLGDNIIELNGSAATNGGLLVKDPTNPNQISGSLLWDSANDYWKGGQLGSEEKIVLISELNSATSSLSSSINTLSGSLSASISQLSGSVSTSIDEIYTAIDNLEIGLNASNIWQETGSFYSTNENIQITGSGAGLMTSPDGSTVAKYALSVSQSIHAANVNVGIPTSNDWKTSLEGSYFNNFDKNTDVSEILRFVAGLLSSSAPDASPNTKTYSTYTKNSVNTTTGTIPGGIIPQSSTNTTITYLNSKGFATAGSALFSAVTGSIYTNSSLGHTFTSVAGGSTNVSSSVDTQLFGLGLLSSGTPTSFKVSGSFTFKFKNNSSRTDTATSSSAHLLTQTGAGTTNGVTLAKINTANPAVIPAAYQDGKYATVFSPTIYNGGATAVSGSGYYHISSSISIASGSSAFTTPIDSYTEIFYSPLTTVGTNIPAQTPTFSGVAVTALTAVSRSLSGAPYLTGATWNISGSILGLFNPMYYNSTIATITDSDALVTEAGGVPTVVIGSGLISTANAVYDSTGVTARSTSTVPYETDIVKVNTVSTFAPSTNENINQTGLGTTSYTLTITGYNKDGTTTSTGTTVNYHTAGTFGHPSASGSMAYYGAVQGTDASATALYEPFLGENYRIQLADNVLAFNGTAWSTSFGLYNLGNTDLQVKPGYLVKPGGTYGYWLTNPSAASDYKYYIRRFQTSGTKTSMTLNLGQALVNWGATTSNSVAALVLFESSKNTIYTPARLYDPSNLLDNFTATKTANTDGQNPFGVNFSLYGNTGGSLSSTTYTIPLRNGDGMTINASYDEIYVLVRYKGDPTPISSITVAFS